MTTHDDPLGGHVQHHQHDAEEQQRGAQVALAARARPPTGPTPPAAAPGRGRAGAPCRGTGGPPSVNRSRFYTRNVAKKTISRILANSPGWMEKMPSRSQILAPLTSDSDGGSSAGQREQHQPDEAARVAVAGQHAVVPHDVEHHDEQHQRDRRPHHLASRELVGQLDAERARRGRSRRGRSGGSSPGRGR